MLRIEGERIALLGEKSARIFLKGHAPREVRPDESMQFLLESI